MNPIIICLFLPIACVIGLPAQYEHHEHHHHHHGHENHDLSNEFWSHHFGPDFQHAIHLQLEQTDLIDTGNVIDKHQQESKEGNKKRSAYIIHKPQTDEQQENRTIENSMRVHLLQPDEIEALEKEMLNYAKENKMVQSPVVVHLPESEASMPKNRDHETPVVLNLPPVVYHSNVNMLAPHYVENAKNTWSQNRKYTLFENKGQHSYEKVQPHHEKVHHSYEKIHSQPTYEKTHSAYDKVQPSYDSVRSTYEQPLHEYNIKPEPEEKPVSLPFNENKKPLVEEARQVSASYEDKVPAAFDEKKQPTYEDGRDTKEGKKAEVL